MNELRHIEGFPVGEDKDVLALSYPPHYTAYPDLRGSLLLHESAGQGDHLFHRIPHREIPSHSLDT